MDTKMMKWDKIENILYALEDDIDDVIKLLQSFKQKYPKNKLRLDVDYFYESCNVTLEIYRLETDEEFNERIQKQKDTETALKNRELNELERLKNKYA